MKLRFKPHIEILPPAQQALWPALASTPKLGFVLYGGTAIALRLGHRNSVDFDFFSEHALDRTALQTDLPLVATAKVLQDRPNALTLAIEAIPAAPPVKVSFFGAIGFGRVGQPEFTEDGALCVASLDDLLATKLKVLLQRVEAKDYLDIAALLTAGIDLGHGLAAARCLFGDSFQPSESLKALVFFEGGDLASLPLTTRKQLISAAASVRELPRIECLSSSLESATR